MDWDTGAHPINCPECGAKIYPTNMKGKIMYKKRIVFVMLAMMFIFSGCAGNQIKPIQEWTPLEKATWFMSLYNSEYTSYQAQASAPFLTEEKKAVLRIKKQVLTEVYPLIMLYEQYVDDGKIPSEALENQINVYFDRISEAAIGGKK